MKRIRPDSITVSTLAVSAAVIIYVVGSAVAQEPHPEPPAEFAAAGDLLVDSARCIWDQREAIASHIESDAAAMLDEFRARLSTDPCPDWDDVDLYTTVIVELATGGVLAAFGSGLEGSMRPPEWPLGVYRGGGLDAVETVAILLIDTARQLRGDPWVLPQIPQQWLTTRELLDRDGFKEPR